MRRVPEPELMDSEAQARAYAEGDFEAAHQGFIDHLSQRFQPQGWALDLGCGPADITTRFAHAFPQVQVHGVDAGPNMLGHGRARVTGAGLQDRVALFLGRLPQAKLPRTYDFLLSNSLLHHLPDPMVLWESLRVHGKARAGVFVMDLHRPASVEEAHTLVETWSGDEPEVLRLDFFHSLRAAYTSEEVRDQLGRAGLDLEVEKITDRHLLVTGTLPG